MVQDLPSVMGRSSKPETIAPNASNGGLLLRWGSFGLRELARFKELLEKPVKLKPSTTGMSKEEFEQRWARKSLRETLSAVEEHVGHDDGFEEGNNGHDEGFEHKNRGARGRAGLGLSSRGERSGKCSTQ
ncbi:hypothetical protein Gotur_012638 [Gossypium turneri]